MPTTTKKTQHFIEIFHQGIWRTHKEYSTKLGALRARVKIKDSLNLKARYKSVTTITVTHDPL